MYISILPIVIVMIDLYLPFDCVDIYVDDLYPVVDSLLSGISYKTEG